MFALIWFFVGSSPTGNVKNALWPGNRCVDEIATAVFRETLLGHRI